MARRREDPEVAIAARLLTPTGAVLWSDVRGLTGAETAGALGLSRAVSVRGVADRLVAALLEAVPRSTSRRCAPRRPVSR